MPAGYLAAFLLAPASGSLRNESEHVQRGLVRVAGSPELAQLCFSGVAAGRRWLCQAGGPEAAVLSCMGVGSQEPALAPGRCNTPHCR